MRYFKLFVPITLIFLAFALYRGGYLKVPVIYDPLQLLWAYLSVMAALMAATACWGRALSLEKFPVSPACCMAGMGLSVFAKYVPGKVWVVVGRAGYVAEDMKYPVARLMLLSLKLVLLSIWTGLAMGSVVLVIIGETKEYGLMAGVGWLVMTVLVFTSLGETLAVGIGNRVLGKEYHLPKLDIRTVLRLVPYTTAHWFGWGVGFYFLINGLLDVDVTLTAGMIYPLAAVLGMVAVFVPGGLGVRELILTGLLVPQGIAVEDAATIAVTSRLWALSGEASLFVLGIIAHRIRKGERQRDEAIQADNA